MTFLQAVRGRRGVAWTGWEGPGEDSQESEHGKEECIVQIPVNEGESPLNTNLNFIGKVPTEIQLYICAMIEAVCPLHLS